MPAQPQFLSDFNIIGTKMLRNELRNFWVGDCIDSKHAIILPPVCATPSIIEPLEGKKRNTQKDNF